MSIETIWSRPPQNSRGGADDSGLNFFGTHISAISEQMGVVKTTLETLKGSDDRIVKSVESTLEEIHALRKDFFAEAKKVQDDFSARSEGLERRLAVIESRMLAEESERKGRIAAFKLVVSVGSAAAAVIGWAIGHFLRIP